jgi:hypothetical protein
LNYLFNRADTLGGLQPGVIRGKNLVEASKPASAASFDAAPASCPKLSPGFPRFINRFSTACPPGYEPVVLVIVPVIVCDTREALAQGS